MKVSQAQIASARSADLARFLRQQGEELVEAGTEHRWKRHDSVTIRGSKWFQFSTRKGGDPIDFVMAFYGQSFVDAVLTLTSSGACASACAPLPAGPRTFEAKKGLELPEKNADHTAVWEYLTKTRCISEDIADFFLRREDIYESKAHHNAVFLGRDTKGTPRYVHIRGTGSQRYCRDGNGSDKAFNFCYRGKDSNLFVFEAPIDLLSFLSLYSENWENSSYLALGGVGEGALLQFLQDTPRIHRVFLCLDRDRAGEEAVSRIRSTLAARPRKVRTERLCSIRKDWNEDLQEKASSQGSAPQPAVSSPEGTSPASSQASVKASAQGSPLPAHQASSQKPAPGSAAVSPASAVCSPAAGLFQTGSGAPQSPQAAAFIPEQDAQDLSQLGQAFQASQASQASQGFYESASVQQASVELVCMGDVPQQEEDWLWKPCIPFGRISLVQGGPGAGKTAFAIQLCAACTNPSAETSLPLSVQDPFSVLFQANRHEWSGSLRPRLLEAGADLHRIFMLPYESCGLSLFCARLETAIQQSHARLVILDGVQDYIEEESGLRSLQLLHTFLQRLGGIAERTGCAIVIAADNVLGCADVRGSLASPEAMELWSAADSVLQIRCASGDPSRREFALVKSSLILLRNSISFSPAPKASSAPQCLEADAAAQNTAPEPEAADSSRLETAPNGEESGSGLHSKAASGNPGAGAVPPEEPSSAASEAAPGEDEAPSTKVMRAQKLIMALLSPSVSLPNSVIQQAVQKMGISSRTFRLAKANLGSSLSRQRIGTDWFLSLNQQDRTDALQA